MKDSGKQKLVVDAGPKACFERAGLPANAAAVWHKAGLRVTGNFKRDAAAGTKFWRDGAGLLARLPKKPVRTPEQQLAADVIQTSCRQAREDFLLRHAEAVYRKLTKNLGVFVGVDEIVYDAARLVPGLTPSRKEVEAESPLMQSEKDGVEIDQGIFLAQVLARPDTGMHLCHAMLRPKPEAADRVAEFVRNGVIVSVRQGSNGVENPQS